MIMTMDTMKIRTQITSPPAIVIPASMPPKSHTTILITSHSSGIARARISRIRNDIATNLSISPIGYSALSTSEYRN